MAASIRALPVAEQAIPVSSVFVNMSQHAQAREKVGMITQVEWENGNVTEGIKHCCCAYLVIDGDKRILVDTGTGDVERIRRIRNGNGDNFYLKGLTPLQDQLAALGIQPEDIDIVINTHLHWDHLGGNELFPNARFYMPQQDLALALNAPDWAPHFFKDMRSCVTSVADRTIMVNEAAQITPHIQVVRVGGHTPGSMAVLIETEDRGVVALAGDVMCKYENLRENWIGPSGNVWNLSELVEAFDYLPTVSDVIVPSHDWRIFDEFPNGVIAEK